MTDRRVDLLFDARHIRQSGIGTYIATLLPSLEETFAERGLSLAVLVNDHAVPELRHARIVTAAPAAMYTLGSSGCGAARSMRCGRADSGCRTTRSRSRRCPRATGVRSSS